MPITARLQVSSMLEVNSSWKILMGAIPKVLGGSENETRKYSSEHVR